MKSLPRVVKPYLFSLIVIGLAFLAAAVGTPPAVSAQPGAATPSPTAMPPDLQSGSTDGILLFAGLILLIIVIPIIWKHREWKKQE